MTLAFLCPGQGAQTPGFLHDLPDHPAVAETVREASHYLGFDVLDLDGAEALRSTVAVQIATVVASVATARALAADGVRPDMVAGLSVGSYSAAIIADAIDFGDGLLLLHKRASLMAVAYPTGYGLAVVAGLTENSVRKLIAGSDQRAYIANLNSPTEFVISGAVTALLAVLAEARKFGARRAELLDVAVPSHCPLLSAVADELTEIAATIPMRSPAMIYIGNRRCRVLRDAAQVREELATNLAFPVPWHDATTLMQELGAEMFLELLPGNVLSGLARFSLPALKAVALQELSLEQAVSMVGKI
ncbi:ACP S-malonyltransferase [Govanella unica]|uniref:Malonyl CoA-acyl carrier protein transacylase n=1 Tax=Govanella unica TaxID=2975056 RepID=A0A9X3TYR3_9PROT|nr:malonate decarboxylase subunit epsilon [Govania unica]MDA5194204.1 malonate decarboxylase subunit epsilon [Govania unica]